MPESKALLLGNQAKAPAKDPAVGEPAVEKPKVEEVPAVEAAPQKPLRVKYVGGQGIELAYPLSTGLRSMLGGVVYEVNYGDFCRLTEASKLFVEVTDEPAR